MANESLLLMDRTQFPAKIKGIFEEDYSGEEDDWEVIYPPVHPSIIEPGIELKRASRVIDDAVDDSIQDLIKMAETVPSIKTFLESLKDPQSDKFVAYKEGDLKLHGGRVEISNFLLNPKTNQLEIQCEGVYLGGGSFYPKKDDSSSSPPFQYYIGKGFMSSPLPEQLAKEYELEIVEKDGKIMCYMGANYWRGHNLDFITIKIFCKNFAIAYNNAVIRDKYSLNSQNPSPPTTTPK